MKTFNKLFLLIFTALLSGSILSSCTNANEDKRVALDYGTIRSTELDDIRSQAAIKYDELTSKIAHKDSFMLVVYTPGCGCWDDFAPVVTEFMNKTHCNVEYLSVYELTIQKDQFGIYTVASDMPSVCLFKRGQLKIQSTYGLHDKLMFKNYSHFQEFADANIILPKMYYIDEATYDSYISSNKEFNLYVARKLCPDCQALDREVLYNWSDSIEKINNNLYIFDIQSYYPTTEEDKPAYQALKDKLGLSEETNPTLGYSTGMVPTLQHRKGNEITDMITVLNDMPDYGGDSTKLESYFTAERVSHMPFLKNTTLTVVLDEMTLSEEQVSGWFTGAKDAFNAQYHYPIANLFLDTYCK